VAASDAESFDADGLVERPQARMQTIAPPAIQEIRM